MRLKDWWIYLFGPSWIFLGLALGYYAIPHTVFFDYHEVTPAQTFVEEELTFDSIYSIRRTVRLEFLDIIYCENGSDNFTRKREFKSTGKIQRPGENKKVTWTFEDWFPPEPATCFMESEISYCLILNWCKTQPIRGQVFEIAYREEE